MVKYDKPFLDRDDMFKMLRYEKNLIINDEDFADEVIRKLSYYDLVNGSKEAFIIKCPDGKEVFKNGVTIEDLYNFHLINDTFQNIIVRRLFAIENMFKNELAYVIAQDFGVHEDEYLDPFKYRKYIKNKKEKVFVSNILSNIRKEIDDKGNPTKHYRLRHNHIPPWILFKNINFHTAIQIFECLEDETKEKVSNRIVNININNKNGIIKNMLNISRLYRNEIVHNYKFLTYRNRINVTVKGIAPLIPPEMLINKSSGKDVYTVILSILILLGSDRLRLSFVEDLVEFIESSYYYENDVKKLYELYFNLLTLPTDFVEKIYWCRDYLRYKDFKSPIIDIQANKNSKLYHVPGGNYYNKINDRNLIVFDSEIDAINSGYRKSKK